MKYEFIKENVLHENKIGAVRYIPKSKFIFYAVSPEKLPKPTSDTYRALIRELKGEGECKASCEEMQRKLILRIPVRPLLFKLQEVFAFNTCFIFH